MRVLNLVPFVLNVLLCQALMLDVESIHIFVRRPTKNKNSRISIKLKVSKDFNNYLWMLVKSMSTLFFSASSETRRCGSSLSISFELT